VRAIFFRRRRIAALIAVGIVFTASACSSTATTSNAGAAPASGSASASCKPAPSGSALKVGVISTDTGGAGLQGQGDAPAAVAAWKKYVTCQGGIAGHPVDITYINDQSNPAVSVQAAKTLVGDHVIAIMDNSTLDSGWAKIVDAAHIPVLSMMASIANLTFTTDPNFYANQNLGIPTGQWGIAKAASLSGKKKLGLLYCTEVPTCASLPKLLTPLAKEVGMTLVYSAAFSQSQPSYTALCLAARAKGVQVFSPIGTPQEMLKVYTDCGSQGYQPVATFVGQGLGANVASYASQVPEIYGGIGTVPWFVHNAATKPFDDALAPYINSSAFKATGNTPSGLLGDWVGLQMFAAAAKNVGTHPTAADITKGLLAFRANTIGGLTSPLTFTPGHLRGNCEFFFAIKDGKYELPEGLKPICRNTDAIPS
jgi:branched-chain amino acid transport system substrate-binding protein